MLLTFTRDFIIITIMKTNTRQTQMINQNNSIRTVHFKTFYNMDFSSITQPYTELHIINLQNCECVTDPYKVMAQLLHAVCIKGLQQISVKNEPYNTDIQQFIKMVEICNSFLPLTSVSKVLILKEQLKPIAFEWTIMNDVRSKVKDLFDRGVIA